MLSNERLGKTIFENKLDDLSDMILDGLNINRKYKYPVGCQYLALNDQDMILSGYYLPFVEGDSSGQYIADFDKKYGGEIQWTPLMLACAYGRHSIVNFLISKGADKTITDAAGRTAVEIAEEFDVKIKFEDVDMVSKLEQRITNLKKENESLLSKLSDLERKIEKLEKEPRTQVKKSEESGNYVNDVVYTNVKTAIYDYEGSDGALSMNAGDKFEVIETEGDWSSVINIITKQEGWVPKDYLE